MKKAISPILIVFFLLLTTVVIIGFGRGYRLDFGKKQVLTTGLLAASSDPQGAQIFVNGELKSATNATIILSPGWYQVKLVKEGYLPWEKKMKVLGEVVAETQATLFPNTPSLAPLTTTGVVAPVLSPDGTKLVFAVPPPSVKEGLWLLNLNSSPLWLNRDPQLLAKNTAVIDFSQAIFSWSPDSKEILITLGGDHYLIEADKGNQLSFVDRNGWQTLINGWQEETNLKQKEKFSLFPPEVVKIATESAKILSFSPDETKLLYQATASAILPLNLNKHSPATNSTPESRDLKSGDYYVYDLKEDKNYQITLTSQGNDLSWFPSSRHLVEITSDKISLLEYDGINKVAIYSGPFEKFVATLPDGNRLLILTTLNRLPGPSTTGSPNLYSVNLR